MANYLTTNGITWTFDKELTLTGASDTYQYGQYCNGDYWVVGPVTIISQTPAWNSDYNGAELNPIPDGWHQGLTVAAGSNYADTYQASRNIATTYPRTFQANSSILGSSGGGQCSTTWNQHWTHITNAAVLTIVSTPPASGSFRPGYAGTTKTIRGTESDLRYDRLGRVAPVSGGLGMAYWNNIIKDTFPSHTDGGWKPGVIAPCGGGPDDGYAGYNSYNAIIFGESMLYANCDYTAEEKRDIVVNLVQRGIDFYEVMTQQAPGRPMGHPDGGHGCCEKAVIMFAGAVLDNADMLSYGDITGDYLYQAGVINPPADYLYTSPDNQVFYIKSADVDRGVGYTAGDIGTPEWGIRHADVPTLDDPVWGGTGNRAYRTCCTASRWGAAILAIHIMSAQGLNLRNLWNEYAIFDYLDRYVSIEGGISGRASYGSWANNMWSTYRSAYPPVWPAAPGTDTTPPLPPTSLVSPQQTDSTISLSWTAAGQAADGDYPVGYRIYRDGNLIISITGTTYTDTGLSANTSYLYEIYSYDDAGNDSASALSNSYSTEVAATPVTTVYISGNGSAGNGGTSWNDALPTLPATLVRGNTYYIGSGNFGRYDFNDAKNSTKITIKKATLNDHGSETGWNPAYAETAYWGNLTFTTTSNIDFIGGNASEGIKTIVQHNGSSPELTTVDITNSDYIRFDYCDVNGMNGGQGNMTVRCINYDTCTYCYTEHCNIHECADDIINVLHGDHCYWRWNRIYNGYSVVYAAFPSDNGHSDGMELWDTDDCEIIGNFIYGITGAMATSGIFLLGYSQIGHRNLLIANNIIYTGSNIYYAVYLKGTNDLKMYNNIIWGATPNNLPPQISVEETNERVDFRNNICGGVVARLGGDWSTTNTGDYNLITGSNNGYLPGTHDVLTSDPKFTNVAATGPYVEGTSIADFAPLNETAPSIDAGVAIAEVAFDIQHYGRPQGVGYDIGAFEYTGGVATTGACCNTSTGECEITTEVNCAHTWLGAGSTCLECITEIPTEGLVVSYTCDETSGTTVADASGNGTDGTLLNDASFTGVGEVEFDDEDEALHFATTDMQYSRGTVACAMYSNTINQIPAGYTYSSRFLFGHGVGYWSNRIQIWQDNGYLQVGMGDNHFSGTDVAVLIAQEWTHVALTWQDSGISISNGTVTGSPTGSGTWILYVDGIQAGTGTYSGLSELNTIAAFGNTSGLASPNNQEAFDGKLDNLKVYDTPLSASDVADLAYLDTPGVPVDPPTVTAPAISNTAASDIEATTVTLGGEVTSTGGEIPNVTLYYGTSDEMEVAGNWDSSIYIGAVLSTFTIDIGDLTHNTTYYFRCYAENGGGSDWATSTATFDTLEIVVPTITQDAASNIESTTATVSGDVTDDGNEEPTITLYYGLTDEGVVPGNWDSYEATELAEDYSFNLNLSGLSASTKYYFRWRATNSAGDTWGSATLDFTTDPTGAPTVINTAATDIEGTQARIGGEVTDVGLDNPTVTVYWGTSDGGITPANWENTASFGVQTGAFNVLLTDLDLATVYYYRAYATNSFGSDWANSTQSFSTLAYQPISPDPNDKSDGFCWGWYDNAYEISTPYDEEEVFNIHKVTRGDTTYLAHKSHWPRKLTRYGDRDWRIEEIDFTGGPFLDANTDTTKTCQYVNGTGGTTGNYYNVGNTGTLNAVGHTPFTENHVGSLWLLEHTRQDNVVDTQDNNTHATPTGSGIRVKGEWQFDVSNMSGGTPNYTAKIWRKALPGDWQEIRHYSGATLASGDEDEDDVFYTWTADNSAVEGVFNAIGQQNKGIVKITSFVSSTQVAVEIKDAVYQESGTSAAVSDWAEGAWNGYRGYPTSVTFFGNRLWWAGTPNNPQGLWGSKVGYYEDHTPGVANDDAVSRTISDNDVSSIEWLMASQALLIGSAKKEYIGSAADRRDPITPTDLDVKPHSANGSLHIQPVEVDGGMMYAQRLGYKMLILYYDYLNDAYESVDANRLSPHMFKYPATGLAKQGTPGTVLWVPRQDGTMCIFRYDKDEEIAAWSRLVTGSSLDEATHAFISTAIVAGTIEDRVWVVVQRVINGVTHYYIERFAYRNYTALSNALYLDAARTFTSNSAGTIERLFYLEGYSVTLMLDTEKVGTYTISNGEITGLTANTTYTLGLPYLSRMRMMMFAVPGVVTEGSIKKYLNVLLRVVKARGGRVGILSHGTTNYVDMNISYSELATDVEKFGEGGFDKDARLIIEFNDPYPATVLCAVFEMDIEQ